MRKLVKTVWLCGWLNRHEWAWDTIKLLDCNQCGKGLHMHPARAVVCERCGQVSILGFVEVEDGNPQTLL